MRSSSKDHQRCLQFRHIQTVWLGERLHSIKSHVLKYAVKIGNSAVAKRLGFLMETLGLGNIEALRKVVILAPGFSPLDPTLPHHGKYNRRWGLLVNSEIKA